MAGTSWETAEMSSELVATYSGLGTLAPNGKYYRGEECLACVKDLIRALREDDGQCEIRRQLGKAGILKKDLMHILVDCEDNLTLRNDVIRLLVNLTQPAYLCFGSSYPQGKESHLMRCFMDVNQHLRLYKEAFTDDHQAMNVLGSILGELCQKESEDREDEDVIVIERILLLIRNLLHISAESQEEKRTEDDVSIHDQIIWKLHINGMDELLIFLGSNPEESQWCMHLLEILFLLFKEQSPTVLANTGTRRSELEKKRDLEIVEEVLAKEKTRKKQAQQIRGLRHNSFGGTFVVKNQKSISGGERVYHKPLTALKDHSYDIEKRPRRVNKRQRPVGDLPKDRVSTYSIRLVLKNLCVQFLECCYNPLMKVVKDSIMRHRAMDNDETYYLWALRFFMQFNRIHDFRVDIVGETLQLPTLHYIVTLTANYYESMVVEKRSVMTARQWAQRLHYVIQCYQEILLYIQHMNLSHDETLKESTKVMMSNVFYHSEYREVFVTLFRNYYEVFQTKCFLRDLVETTHVYLRLLEQYCSQNRHVVVQEKKRGGGGKKKKKKKGGGSGRVLTADQLMDLWDTIDARVAELLEGVEPLPASHAPFDPRSTFSLEEQKIGVMGRIKMFLIDARHPEAVSLLRAAREVWPEAEFGASGFSVDEEMDVMRDILFNPIAALPAMHLLEGEESDEDEEGGGGGGGATTATTATTELEFSLNTYLQRFANNKIIRAYSVILADYSTNPEAINHAVVKMLYRIAVQLKMAPLLYQISIFNTFLAVLSEPAVPRIKELQKFCRHIVQGFLHMTAKNPLMFVELLFWKTSRDCYDLEKGYGTTEREREQVKRSAVWTREQEDELATLYQKYKEEEDIVGCLEAALEGSEVKRTRRQISKQLVQQCLVLDSKELHRKRPKKGAWHEEDLERLREVFEEMKDSVEPKLLVKAIADSFPHKGVSDVASQLREVGLIAQQQKARGRGREEENLENKKYKSSSRVNTSEDDSSEDDDRPALSGARPGVSGLDRAESAPSGGRGLGRAAAPSGGHGLGGEVRTCVRELCGRGHAEDLQWLEAYLMDEARDRTADAEWEEMCIVAVNDKVAKAMEIGAFQRLLTALDLQPPSQQESYWLIPATMSPQQLTEAADALRLNIAEGHMTDPSDDELDHMTNHNDASYEMDDHMTGGDRSHDHGEGHVTIGDPSPRSRHSNVKASRTEALKKLVKKRTSGLKAPRSVKVTSRPLPEPKSTKRPRLALRSEFLDSDDEDDSFSFIVGSGAAASSPPSQGGTRGSPSEGGGIRGSLSQEGTGSPPSQGGTGSASLRLGSRRQHFLDSGSEESDDGDIMGPGRSVKVSRVEGEESCAELGEGLDSSHVEGSHEGEGQDEDWSSDEEHNLVICE